MEQEKIASRLILADGTTLYIGTTGLNENVAVKLSAPTSENWASKVIVVQNITQATSEEYALSALGECKFTIPMGNVYSIVYPVLSNYKQPINVTFTATLASRSVEYTYSNEDVMYEQINISAQVVGGDVAELNGKMVSALSDNGNAYAAEFLDGRLMLRIPYGEEYKITLPTLDGYVHDGNNIQMVAGIPSRFILVHYSEGLLGYFGIDNEGTQYTIDDIKAMPDTSIITYVGYNDSVLATADRGDGTQGCGVMFSVDNNTVSKQWASANIEFDTTRLPFKSNIDLASKDFASSKNTHNIITIGEELDITTPAASYCDSQIATVGGITRKGYLLAFGVLYRMVQNKTQLDELYLALGKTAPAIHSGGWWSSCQYSATGAVSLYNGGFGTNLGKTHSTSVLVGFDL